MVDEKINYFELAEAMATIWMHGDRQDVHKGFGEMDDRPTEASLLMGLALAALHNRRAKYPVTISFISEIINPHMKKHGSSQYVLTEAEDEP